jgi:diadenosine tetraphosphate (Ap4A) HIT family hydrolase
LVTDWHRRGERTQSAVESEDHCIFCERISQRDSLLRTDALCAAFYDTTPLNVGHILLVPTRHEPDFLALTELEFNAIWRMTSELRDLLDEELQPDGFNVGANIGEAGGQTIGHAHLHLIPRYWGDVLDPKGGIRCLIPARMRYWDKTEDRRQ